MWNKKNYLINMSLTKKQRLELELLSCPGDTILETMEHRNLSTKQFAAKMEMSFSEAYQLIKGKAPLTDAVAAKLEAVLGIDKQFWINREQRYRDNYTRIHSAGYDRIRLLQPSRVSRRCAGQSSELHGHFRQGVGAPV